MPFKVNFLNHLESVQRCLPHFDAEASVDLRTMQLNVRARNQHHTLYPRYVFMHEQRMMYNEELNHATRGFIGWLPELRKRWEIARDKSIFKQYCDRHGIRTPPYWNQPGKEVRDVVIKDRVSSFGYGVRGPYRELASGDYPESGTEKVIYEKFIFGKIAKISYWEDKLVCIEIAQMPFVIGDGKTNLRELIKLSIPASAATLEPNWASVATITRYQGYELESTPPTGQHITIDFKYGSLFLPRHIQNPNALNEYRNSDVEKQLIDAGKLFWLGIPEQIRKSAITVADAIIDDQNRAWFLEVNSNSIVQPDAYRFIFESLFGEAQNQVTPIEPIVDSYAPSRAGCDLLNSTPMTFNINIINHVKSIHEYLVNIDAEAELDLKTLQLKICAGGKCFYLYPRYIYKDGQRVTFSHVLHAGVHGFAGWLTNTEKEPQLSVTKTNFQTYCLQHSIPTLDKIVPGKIARAWYWEGKLVCLETPVLPSVKGDGQTSLRDLVMKSLPPAARDYEIDWMHLADIAQGQGKQLDDVLPDGETCIVDYKFGSRFIANRIDNMNIISEYQDSEIAKQFAAIGRLFWQSFPESERRLALFTLEAIIDAKDEVWFIGADRNPITHPDSYHTIFESLFGPASMTASAQTKSREDSPISTSPLNNA